MRKTFLLSIFTFLTCAISAHAAKASISAQLRPQSISLGETALLTVTIKGDRSASVKIPNIDGLEVINRGRSSNISIINGRFSSSLTLTYLIIPNKTGTFTLSPISAESRGGKITADAKLQLKVTQGAQQPTRKNRQLNPNTPQQLSQKPSQKATLKDIAFLDVVGLKKEAIVGETMPIEIRAVVKSPARLTALQSLPTLSGGNFILKIQDGEPEQGYVTHKGSRYFVVHYRGALTAVKPGTFNTPISMDTTIVVPTQRRTHRRRRGAFNDPFFDDFFDDFFSQRGVEKEVTLTSDPFKMKVTPPPTEGKPADFDGAIGNFTISASASQTKVRSGDPITLTIRVTGKGNLARLHAPLLSDPKGWKTYPPKDHLEDANSTATSGTKVFEQIIVPRNTSVTEIPPLKLSFYNPETKSYQTVSTAPIPVTVTPGTDITDEPITETTTTDTPQDRSENSIQVPHSTLGWLRQSRLDQSPWLYPTVGGLVATLLALAGLSVANRKRNSPERLAANAQQKEINTHLSETTRAAANNDTQAFFAHAKQAIQYHWASKLGIQPNAVTATDIPDPDARAIVEMADNLEFSTSSTSDINLKEWKQRLDDALKK